MADVATTEKPQGATNTKSVVVYGYDDLVWDTDPMLGEWELKDPQSLPLGESSSALDPDTER